MNLRAGLILATLALTVSLAHAQAQPAAVVNGTTITQQQFLEVLQARYGDQVLRDMCTNLALRQAARAAGVAVSKEELERRVQSIQAPIDARAAFTGETFFDWLAKQGVTPEAYVAGLYDQMLLERMVEKQVTISDDDVARFYQANQEMVSEPAQVRVAHIQVKTPQDAGAIRQEITTGKITWEEAAKKYSLDAATRERGGDMGFIPQGESQIQKAAWGLRANNEISQPVGSPNGIHLLRRTGFKAGRVPPFEEVQAQLRDMLRHHQLLGLTLAKRNEILKAAKIEPKLQFPPEGSPVDGATPAPPQ